MSWVLLVGNAVNTGQVLSQHRHRVDTIVHHHDDHDFQLIDLLQINAEKYDWLHLAGCNIAVLTDWLPTLQERFDQVISLAIEKPRAGLEILIPLVDIVFFSKAYACATGFTQAAEFLQYQHQLHPQQILICAWGEQGGYALAPDSTDFLLVATTDLAVVRDTCEAGDVFTAGIIHALSTGQTLTEALAYAVRASHKVAQS